MLNKLFKNNKFDKNDENINLKKLYKNMVEKVLLLHLRYFEWFINFCHFKKRVISNSFS